MQLTRHPANPLLLPDPASKWETHNVFNPAVIYDNGLFHMFYRAQGLDQISRIGYAVSSNGVKWNRLRDPVLEPEIALESRGVEDPRITKIDNRFYMAYTAYSGNSPAEHATTPMYAKSDNLIDWQRIGPLVKNEHSKDHFLMPEQFEGKFLSFHRRSPDIWIAKSEDLRSWPESEMKLVMMPRPDSWWDSKSIGGNGPPIKTDHGWLTLYHGYADDHVYRLGVCLLDLDDLSTVTHRPAEPIFEPIELWELKGDVPNVVFSSANPVVNGIVHVYYGGGDRVIGLATCELDELLEFALTG